MKRKILVTGAVIIAAIILLVLFLRPVETDDKIRVGVILPLTGPLAYLGEEEKNAILLFEDLFPDLKENVEFVFEDSRGEVSHGVTAYHKLKRDGVNYFILSLTRVAEAIKPLLAENNDIGFALSIKPDIAMDNKFMFRAYWGLEEQIPYWINLFKKKGVNSVAALHASDPSVDIALRMFADSCAYHGIAYLGKEDYGFDVTDIRPHFERVLARNPDVIIVEDFGFMFPSILQEAKVRGVSGKIIGGVTATYIPKDALDLADGMIFLGPSFYIDNTPDFQEVYELNMERFDQTISLSGVFAIKSAYLLINAIENVGDSSVDIITFLTNNSFNIMGEKIFIDETGTSRIDYTYGIFVNREVQPYSFD